MLGGRSRMDDTIRYKPFLALVLAKHAASGKESALLCKSFVCSSVIFDIPLTNLTSEKKRVPVEKFPKRKKFPTKNRFNDFCSASVQNFSMEVCSFGYNGAAIHSIDIGVYSYIFGNTIKFVNAYQLLESTPLIGHGRGITACAVNKKTSRFAYAEQGRQPRVRVCGYPANKELFTLEGKQTYMCHPYNEPFPFVQLDPSMNFKIFNFLETVAA